MKATKKSNNKTLFKAAAAASVAALMSASGAFADTVTLTSADKTVVVTGEYIDFIDNNYYLLTNQGQIRVAATGMTCEGAPCDDLEGSKVAIRVAGSDVIGVGVMPILMEVYGQVRGAQADVKQTDVRGQYLVDYIGENGFGDKLESHLVTSSNTGNAFQALLTKSADIGMASRRITPDEARALRDSGSGSMIDPSQEHVIAVDSIVVITHPDNPVSELTVDQLADIYTGKIRNWSELGGDDLPVVVVHRDIDSGTGAVFSDRILGAADAPLSKAAVRMSDDSSVAEIVSAQPSVIGFVGFAFQRGNQPVTLVNECGIPMLPDAFSARTEEYILQRRLYLYNRGDNISQQTKEFLDVVTSAQVDGAILKSGFVDLGVDRREMAADGDRAKALIAADSGSYEGGQMRKMLAEMVDYDRLSTTFRFATGSSRLDERAIIDLERLTGFLETQPEGTEIKFVGFTDDVGEFDGNLRLADNRATQVMAEMQAYAGERLAGISMDTSAYGEISPANCNSSNEGRRINRRVEVWIKRS